MKQELSTGAAPSRARVGCLHSSQSGFIDKPISSQTTSAGARVREGRLRILQAPRLAQDGASKAHVFPRTEKSEGFFICLQTKGETDVCMVPGEKTIALNRGFARCR